MSDECGACITWVSDDLREILDKLTPQQARAVQTIVQAELDGRALNQLLDGPDKICARSTFYGSTGRCGWRDRAEFMQALDLARRDYRKWVLEHSTSDAMVLLSRAAIPSARELERQVTGDLQAVEILSHEMERAIKDGNDGRVFILGSALAAAGVSAALPALQKALEQTWLEAATYSQLAISVSRIAYAVDADRQKAGIGILDRADLKTASKSTVVDSGTKRIEFDLSGLPADLLGSLADAGEPGSAD